MGSPHTEVPSLDVAAFIGSAAQAIFTHLPVGVNPGGAMGTQGIGVRSAEVCCLHHPIRQLFAYRELIVGETPVLSRRAEERAQSTLDEWGQWPT